MVFPFSLTSYILLSLIFSLTPELQTMSPSTKAKFEDLSFPLSPASPSFLRTMSQRRKRGKQPLSHLSPFVSQILLIRPVLCSHHQFGGVPLLWEDIFGLQILQLETFISLEQNTFHFSPHLTTPFITASSQETITDGETLSVCFMYS